MSTDSSASEWEINKLSEEENQRLKKEKWEKERQEQKITLETIYKYKESKDFNRMERSCILYSGNNQMKDSIPSITEGMESAAEFDEFCYKTSWSENRDEEYDREALWIRGNKEEIQKLITEFYNWDDLEGWNLVTKNIDESSIIFGEKGSLNKAKCSWEMTDNNWLDIACLIN